MAKKTKSKTFKSVEEYRTFYSDSTDKTQPKGSRYYRIGANIAKMACEKAACKVESDQTAASVHLS